MPSGARSRRPPPPWSQAAEAGSSKPEEASRPPTPRAGLVAAQKYQQGRSALQTLTATAQAAASEAEPQVGTAIAHQIWFCAEPFIGRFPQPGVLGVPMRSPHLADHRWRSSRSASWQLLGELIDKALKPTDEKSATDMYDLLRFGKSTDLVRRYYGSDPMDALRESILDKDTWKFALLSRIDEHLGTGSAASMTQWGRTTSPT